MFDENLPIIRCEQPVAEFDGYLHSSRYTTDDGHFLVAWPPRNQYSPRSIDLIDLYRGEKA